MLRLTRLIGAGYLLICLVALLGVVFVGPLGYAPARLPFARTPEPVVVTIWYGTEKRAWLEDAAQRFAASGPQVGGRPVQIVLRGIGSREQSRRIAAQDWRSDGPPAAISPASSLWVEALRAEWAARNGGVSLVAGGADAPRPLAQTPLVLVAWRERGDLIWRDPAGDTWRQLHDALAQPGWSALGGSEDWGPVKLGQTSPALSNSGAQALALMAYSFFGRTGSLSAADAQSPELAAWLATFQSAVPEFGESTGDLMTTMLQRGPSTYDVALVYESTAIEALAAPRTWGALQVYYPPATLVSDHPFAILDAPWASAAERDGARLFRDFLLARESQERALSYGLRPANAAVSAGALGAQSPFVLYRDQGLRAELPPAAETPAPEAIEALLAEWERQHGR